MTGKQPEQSDLRGPLYPGLVIAITALALFPGLFGLPFVLPAPTDSRLFIGANDLPSLLSLLSGSHLHTLLDGVALAVTALIVAGARMQYSSGAGSELHLEYIAAGFAVLLASDLHHAISAPGFLGISQNPWADTVHNWLICRLVAVITLAIIGAFLLSPDLRRMFSPGARATALPVLVFSMVLVVLMQSSGPDEFGTIENSELMLSRPYALVALVIACLLAGLVLFPLFHQQPTLIHQSLLCASAPWIASDLVLLAMDNQPYTPGFNIAHSLKIFSYLIVMEAIYANILRQNQASLQRAQSYRELLASMADKNGELLNSEATFRTLSQQNSTRLRLQESRVRNLEALAAAAAYGLRGSLREILVLSSGKPADDPAETSRAINRSAQQLLARLDSLRLCTDLGAADGGVSLARLDLQTVVQQVIVDLHFEIEDAHADIRLEVLPQIVGDADLIRRMFRELLENSLRFHDRRRQPRIRIHTLPARIADQTGLSGGTVVGVDDNGPGIPADQLEQVFRYFHRLDERPGHTGCGLALCRRIMDRHYGRIWLEAASGGGCAIRLWFPEPSVVHIMRADQDGDHH